MNYYYLASVNGALGIGHSYWGPEWGLWIDINGFEFVRMQNDEPPRLEAMYVEQDFANDKATYLSYWFIALLYCIVWMGAYILLCLRKRRKLASEEGSSS